MLEIYDIVLREGRLDFLPTKGKIQIDDPNNLNDSLLKEGWLAFTHLGDPELMHCSVYRKRNVAGAIFVMQALDSLFMAQTDSNLIFSMACGHFADMVANIRYGADIWEEMEGTDA